MAYAKVDFTRQLSDFLYTFPLLPAGSHDAYAKGAKVTHNGKQWVSSAENNVWEPEIYGWKEWDA